MRTGYGIKDIAEHGRICRKTSRQSVEEQSSQFWIRSVFDCKVSNRRRRFFTVPSGSVTFVRILLLRCVYNENNGPRINRSSSKASTGNFSQGLTSLSAFAAAASGRAYPKELSFVQQLLVGFPLLSEELFQRCLSFQE